jgi:Na+/phosphate symporter
MTYDPATVTLEGRRAAVFQMGVKTLEMLKLTRDAFVRQDRSLLGPAAKLGQEIHRQEKALIESLLRGAGGPRPATPDDEPIYLPMHLERIGDNIESLIGAIRKVIDEGVLFTERAKKELSELFGSAIELSECIRDAVQTDNHTLIKHVLEEGRRFEARANDFALFHQQRLIEGICLPRASSVFLAMLDHLKGVEWHARQIAAKLASTRLSAEQIEHRHPRS